MQPVRFMMPESLFTSRKLFFLFLGLLLTVAEASAQDDRVYLNVSINLFEPDTQVSQALDSSPELRQAEASYIPILLALRLADTERWGAVRVSPVPDLSAELSITGEILHSDHQRLSLHIKAVDSSGLVWIDKVYDRSASNGVSLMISNLLQDPFSSVYSNIVSDLDSMLIGLSLVDAQTLQQLSLLRYGAALSAGTFQGYFSQDEQGNYSLLRLPSDDDPMLRRIRNIRDREYLFIDVVNEHFQQFFVNIKPLYDLWRSAQAEQQVSSASYIEAQQIDAAEGNDFNPGSYYALREQYERYRWIKVEQQYQQELIQGFANEAKPTEIALDESLVNLQGTLQEQYDEWRSVLKELLMLETGAIN